MEVNPARIQGLNVVDTSPHLATGQIGNIQFIEANPDTHLTDLGRDEFIQVNPDSFTTGSISNSPILFRIKPDLCGGIEETYIEFTAAETGGSSTVTPIELCHWIDRIEIGVNGVQSPFVTYYGDVLYAMLQFFTTEQLTNLLAFN